MDEVKPTFQLNKAQKNLLATKEHESFDRHCKRFNWNPKDKEQEFYENFIKRDRSSHYQKVLLDKLPVIANTFS